MVALLLVGILGATERRAASSDLRAGGEAANDELGGTVALGDVTGDGNADIVVSATERDTDAGASAGVLYVLLGPLSGEVGLASADTTIEAEAAGDQAGFAVLAGPDLDADGIGDVVLSSRLHDPGGAVRAGRVYVVHGPPASGTLSLSDADVVISGTWAGEVFGNALASSDWDGDGHEDLVVSAESYGGTNPAVLLFPGAALGGSHADTDAEAIWTGAASDGAGEALTTLDGDTLVVADPFCDDGEDNGGCVFLLQGPLPASGSLSDVASSLIVGTMPAGTFGYEVAGLDLDSSIAGDELVVSDGDQRVRVFFEPWLASDDGDAAWILATDEGSSSVELGLASAGDVDGDGTDDLLVGDPSADGSGSGTEGSGYLLYGGSASWPATLSELCDASSTAGVCFPGGSDGDFTGRVLAGGDVNQDGKSDVLIGAPRATVDDRTEAGLVRLYYGPFDRLEGTFSLVEADASVDGDDAFDLAGWAVAGVGDVDCDGIDDVVIGALFAEAGAGGAGIWFGPAPGGSPLAWLGAGAGAPDAASYGETPGDLAGGAIAGVGDVNGDGCGDFLVGAAGDDTVAAGAGAASLTFGSPSLSEPSAEFFGIAAGDRLGLGLAGLGDLDGDGFDDLALGAPGANAVYVFYGGEELTDTFSAADADFVLTGEGRGDRAGWSLAGGLDFDGDGHGDLAVGAPGNRGDAGAVYVISGGGARWTGSASIGASDYRVHGAPYAGQLGHALAAAADIDGDGFDDLVAGAPYYGVDDGRAYWIPGTDATGDALVPAGGVSFCPEQDVDRVGWSVGAGDVDGDGADDLIYGAPWLAERRGGAYLFYADTIAGWKGTSRCRDGDLADVRMGGEVAGDLAGWSVAAVGDPNQDGEEDLIVGACGSDRGGSASGAAYVVLASH